MRQKSKYKTDLSCFLCGSWYGLYLGRKYAAWNFGSCAFLLQCRDVFLCETLGSLFLFEEWDWLGQSQGFGFVCVAVCDLRCLFVVTLCCVQTSPCHIDTQSPSSQELRKAGERKRKALQDQTFSLLSILCCCCGEQLFFDRLSKFWEMWSPFQCCHSYSFLSGQYQGRCQAGDGFTSFWFLHFSGFTALWLLLFLLNGWNSKPK